MSAETAEPWCDWCQCSFGREAPNWKVETSVVTGWFCSKACADHWSGGSDTPEHVGDRQIVVHRRDTVPDAVRRGNRR